MLTLLALQTALAEDCPDADLTASVALAAEQLSFHEIDRARQTVDTAERQLDCLDAPVDAAQLAALWQARGLAALMGEPPDETQARAYFRASCAIRYGWFEDLDTRAEAVYAEVCAQAWVDAPVELQGLPEGARPLLDGRPVPESVRPGPHLLQVQLEDGSLHNRKVSVAEEGLVVDVQAWLAGTGSAAVADPGGGGPPEPPDRGRPLTWTGGAALGTGTSLAIIGLAIGGQARKDANAANAADDLLGWQTAEKRWRQGRTVHQLGLGLGAVGGALLVTGLLVDQGGPRVGLGPQGVRLTWPLGARGASVTGPEGARGPRPR